MSQGPVKPTLLRLDMDTGHYNCRDYVISPHFAPTTLATDLRIHHESFDELEARSRSPASQKPKFPLLKLPLELRQDILRYLLPCTQEHGMPIRLGAHGRQSAASEKDDSTSRHLHTQEHGMPLRLGAHGSQSTASENDSSTSRLPQSDKTCTKTSLAVGETTKCPPKSSSNRQMSGPTTSLAAGETFKCSPRPSSNRQASGLVNNVIWRRGNTKLFSVCRQLHRECAELMYGTNTFLLFVNYSTVKFRYRWLLPSGMAPIREYPLLETMPRHYMHLVRHVVINIEHVDAYTGMVKFNVSGKGLVAGLQDRVQSLVHALTAEAHLQADAGIESSLVPPVDHLSRVTVHVSDQNRTVDSMKYEVAKQRDEHSRTSEDIEKILAPLQQLRTVHSAHVIGCVSREFAQSLEDIMMSI